MKPAARSYTWFDPAALARIGFAFGAALVCATSAGSARADVPPPRELVVIPSECAQYWTVPDGITSPAAWNQFLSFAACMQDATVAQIEDADELDGLVEDLQSALDPTVKLYLWAVEDGPAPIKIRAALHVAMAEAALITRARTSIVVPQDLRTNAAAAARHRQLHARLEPLLEPQAVFAYTLISVVDRAVTLEPRLAPDAVTRNLMVLARRVAAQLRTGWSIPEDSLRSLRLARFVNGPQS